MTAQEQQLIDDLVERIRTTSVQDKDTAAEQHLQQGLANTPDALYILAQTVIVQKYGLEQAQQRIQSMQAELDSLREQAAQAKPSGGSFLSQIFGGGSSQSAPSPTPPQAPGWQSVSNANYPQAGYSPAPPAYPPTYPQQSYGYGQPSGWGASPTTGGRGGFLQGALQTAAGVAMGEVAFQGVESLFRGFGGGGGYGHGFGGGQPSETIINNYNDGDAPRHEHEESSRDRDDDRSFYNPHDDASRDSDSHSFADTASDNDVSDDSNDTSDSDDNSGFDSGDDGGAMDDDSN